MVIFMKLTDINLGEKATVIKVCGSSSIVRRLQDMGLVEGCTVVPMMKSPLGDPTAYGVLGSVIAIREYDAQNILVASNE